MFKGKSANGDVACEIHKTRINNLIAGCESDEINKIIENQNENENQESGENVDDRIAAEDDNVHDSSSISLWLDKMLNKVKEVTKNEEKGDKKNEMRNKGFAKHLLRLCKLLPLWSCINCQYFEVEKKAASSANVESSFNDLKHSLGNIIPCRIDQFVQEHIDLNEGAVIDASQKYITFVDASKMQTGILDDADVVSDADVEHVTEGINKCSLCAGGNSPGGAHRCKICNKKVHIIDEYCSVPDKDGDFGSEGYGQKRICFDCNRNRNKMPSKEMDEVEEWEKRPKKKSAFSLPAKHWNLNTDVRKKSTIGVLLNANKSTAIRVGKSTVLLSNTCAFDTITQVSIFLYYK